MWLIEGISVGVLFFLFFALALVFARYHGSQVSEDLIWGSVVNPFFWFALAVSITGWALIFKYLF